MKSVKRILKVLFVSVLVLAGIVCAAEGGAPDDTVTFWGKITAEVCFSLPTEGSCCRPTFSVYGIGLRNGALTLDDEFDLNPYKDGEPHLIRGRYVQEDNFGTPCVYLVVSSVDEFPEATFDSSTGVLSIPNVVVDGEFSFGVKLGEPFNLLDAVPK